MTIDVHDELVAQLRGLLSQAVITAVDDAHDVQTVSLTTHDDVDRTAVQVHQPYGHSSLPPDPNPLTLVLAIGGDQGQQFALQLASATHRFGRLKPGESAQWTHEGSRLHLRTGGNADLVLKALLKIAANLVTITAPGGVTIDGPVTFKGPVTFEQPVTFQANVTMQKDLIVGGTITGTGRTKGAL